MLRLSHPARRSPIPRRNLSRIERTVSTTSEFDIRGNAVRQSSVTYRGTAAAEKITTQTDIVNIDIDNRGDAATQEITTYETDSNGVFALDANNNKIPKTYTVITNREFDGEHNCLNQNIFTYNTKTAYELTAPDGSTRPSAVLWTSRRLEAKAAIPQGWPMSRSSHLWRRCHDQKVGLKV